MCVYLQMELYVKLVKQRNDISQETGFTPHNIASNKVLLDLARFRPSNCENLQRIEDLPAAKAERFGQMFVDTIQELCGQHVIGSLTRIKEQLPVDVEFNHIKVVIASLVGRYGQTTDSAGNLVLNAPVSVPSDDVIIVESDVDGQTTGPTNSASMSQTADQNLKRKLPDWMATNPSKQTFTKKIKANKLFR
nr:hypothetical protein BaRGS_025344 [Batillaria attramentaria]